MTPQALAGAAHQRAPDPAGYSSMACTATRYRCVIFDLDGTLLDTEAAMLAALNALLTEDRWPPVSAADMAQARHHGLGAMLKIALNGRHGEKPMASLEQRLIRHYLQESRRHVRLFPDAAALLATLDRDGVWIGLCSNQGEASARVLLAQFGLSRHFRRIVGGDSLAERKPHPLPLQWLMAEAGASAAETLLVGDSDVDRQTASNAGTALALLRHGEPMALPAMASEMQFDGFAELGIWLATPRAATHR